MMFSLLSAMHPMARAFCFALCASLLGLFTPHQAEASIFGFDPAEKCHISSQQPPIPFHAFSMPAPNTGAFEILKVEKNGPGGIIRDIVVSKKSTTLNIGFFSAIDVTWRLHVHPSTKLDTVLISGAPGQKITGAQKTTRILFTGFNSSAIRDAVNCTADITPFWSITNTGDEHILQEELWLNSYTQISSYQDAAIRRASYTIGDETAYSIVRGKVSFNGIRSPKKAEKNPYDIRSVKVPVDVHNTLDKTINAQVQRLGLRYLLDNAYIRKASHDEISQFYLESLAKKDRDLFRRIRKNPDLDMSLLDETYVLQKVLPASIANIGARVRIFVPPGVSVYMQEASMPQYVPFGRRFCLPPIDAPCTVDDLQKSIYPIPVAEN
jgi:hypothetical protein